MSLLSDQRAAIAEAITEAMATVDPDIPILPLPDSHIPTPCIMNDRLSIIFAESSQLGEAFWEIRVVGVREAADVINAKMEDWVVAICQKLRKGAGVQLVLDNVQPINIEVSGYEVPSYTVTCRSPFPNC